MWKDSHVDTAGFFKDLGLLYDWPDDEASVYEAEDVQQANTIMEAIIHILEGAREFTSPHLAQALTAVGCSRLAPGASGVSASARLTCLLS